MLPRLNKIKGIHPGALLKRELGIRNMKGRELADSIGEHKQTISAILNKRRGVNPKLSIKLSKEFNVDPDYFMLLQASHDVMKAHESETKNTPNIENIRRVIFWDTDIDKIDWDKNRKSIIKRILERGNQKEIEEILSFYGKKIISKEIRNIHGRILPSFKENIEKYNLIQQ